MGPLERPRGKISAQKKTAGQGVERTKPDLSGSIRRQRKDGLAVHSTGSNGSHYTPVHPLSGA